jgi:hypothetical protein
MVLTTGVTFENAAKVFDVPEGVAYTVSFDITDMDPVTDFLFMSDGNTQIIEDIASTGSYSFNGTGSAATELMAFALVENATIHVDNVKLTYGTQPSVSFLADVIQITDYSPFGVLHNLN